MKKLGLILGMIVCIFCLTACGSTEESNMSALGITEEEATVYADQVVNDINAVVQSGMQAQYSADSVIAAALESWESAQEDMGTYQNITGHEVEIGDDSATIIVQISGSIRNAEVELVLDKNLALTSITTNVQYGFRELMVKAAMNTAIGMGTVFVVLILICIIISGFVYIPKIQAAFGGNDKTAAEEKPAAPAASAAPVSESEEELSDDLELVAVIAAAIAASEGASSTDGFVVRSIRRSNTNKWQRA